MDILNRKDTQEDHPECRTYKIIPVQVQCILNLLSWKLWFLENQHGGCVSTPVVTDTGISGAVSMGC
jgi:hypothetical protein